MIKGKLLFEDKTPVFFAVIFESNQKGIPIRRDNKFISTTSNDKGEFTINLPKNSTTFITFQLIGTELTTLKTNNVPTTLILKSNADLPNVDVITSKKFNYLWLLLLIPVIYLITKKK